MDKGASFFDEGAAEEYRLGLKFSPDDPIPPLALGEVLYFGPPESHEID